MDGLGAQKIGPEHQIMGVDCLALISERGGGSNRGHRASGAALLQVPQGRAMGLGWARRPPLHQGKHIRQDRRRHCRSGWRHAIRYVAPLQPGLKISFRQGGSKGR